MLSFNTVSAAVDNFCFLVLDFNCPCPLSTGLNVISFSLGISGYKHKRKGSHSPTCKTKANENVCKDHTTFEIKPLELDGDQTAVAQVLLKRILALVKEQWWQAWLVYFLSIGYMYFKSGKYSQLLIRWIYWLKICQFLFYL